MMDYGDLEKYLGKKYSEELESYHGYGLFSEEASEVLDGSLKVLEMFNRVGLMMQGQGNRFART